MKTGESEKKEGRWFHLSSEAHVNHSEVKLKQHFIWCWSFICFLTLILEAKYIKHNTAYAKLTQKPPWEKSERRKRSNTSPNVYRHTHSGGSCWHLADRTVCRDRSLHWERSLSHWRTGFWAQQSDTEGYLSFLQDAGKQAPWIWEETQTKKMTTQVWKMTYETEKMRKDVPAGVRAVER